MKIYLDTCALQRPLDSRTQIRVTLEAEAVIGLITLLQAGEVELISSEVINYEVKRNPHPERKAYALAVLSSASSSIRLNDAIENRARSFHSLGLKPLDALHLAAAEASEADYFCTTDDRILKRSSAIRDLRIQVVSPIELVEELNQ